MIEFEEIKVEDDVERIVILRKRLGKKQHEFANDINISPIYLNKIENYKTPLTDSIKKKINNYLCRINEVQNS